jgi:hypothetical protein
MPNQKFLNKMNAAFSGKQDANGSSGTASTSAASVSNDAAVHELPSITGMEKIMSDGSFMEDNGSEQNGSVSNFNGSLSDALGRLSLSDVDDGNKNDGAVEVSQKVSCGVALPKLPDVDEDNQQKVQRHKPGPKPKHHVTEETPIQHENAQSIQSNQPEPHQVQKIEQDDTNAHVQHAHQMETHHPVKLNATDEVPGIMVDVFKYVCKKLVTSISDGYVSKVYTPEYAKSLFKGYADGKFKASSNPLFKNLVDECIQQGVSDQYLGDLTKSVLLYIKEE